MAGGGVEGRDGGRGRKGSGPCGLSCIAERFGSRSGTIAAGMHARDAIGDNSPRSSHAGGSAVPQRAPAGPTRAPLSVAVQPLQVAQQDAQHALRGLVQVVLAVDAGRAEAGAHRRNTCFRC